MTAADKSAGAHYRRPERIWARPDYRECWLKRGEEEDVEYVRADLADAQETELARWKDAAGAHHVASMKEAQRADQNAVRADALAQENAKQARRIEALEEALRFYVNPVIYQPHPHGPAFDRRDVSYVAVAALSPTPSPETAQ